jgi:hypothetical protein
MTAASIHNEENQVPNKRKMRGMHKEEKVNTKQKRK